MTFPLNLTDNAFTQKQQLQECVQFNGSQTFPTANNDIYPSFKTLPLVIFSKIKNLVWRICILLSIQICLPNPNLIFVPQSQRPPQQTHSCKTQSTIPQAQPNLERLKNFYLTSYNLDLSIFIWHVFVLDRRASIMDAVTLKLRVVTQLLALDTRLLQWPPEVTGLATRILWWLLDWILGQA